MPRTRRSAWVHYFLFALSSFALVVPPLFAAPRWSVELSGVIALPANEQAGFDLPGNAGAASYGLDGDGGGVQIGLRCEITRRLGVELSASLLSLDVALTRSSNGAVPLIESSELEIYSLGVDWRVLPESAWDPTVGLFVAQSKLDDLIFPVETGPVKFTFDDDYGIGIQARIERPLGGHGRWRASAAVRYLSTIAETDSAAADLDLNPLTIRIGIVRSF